MMHSTNGARIHAERCGGKLTLEINEKPFGAFELYRCMNKTDKKGKPCHYVGRGKKLTDEEIAEYRAKICAQNGYEEDAALAQPDLIDEVEGGE